MSSKLIAVLDADQLQKNGTNGSDGFIVVPFFCRQLLRFVEVPRRKCYGQRSNGRLASVDPKILARDQNFPNK